jgi:hypothetical protein
MNSAPHSLRASLAGDAPDAFGLRALSAAKRFRRCARSLAIARDGGPISSTRTSRRSLRLCCELLHPPSAAAAVSAPSLLLPQVPRDLRPHGTTPRLHPHSPRIASVAASAAFVAARTRLVRPHCAFLLPVLHVSLRA